MRRYPKKGGQFAIIWVDLLYEDSVPASAKLLYGEIYRLSNADGWCDASNEEFCDLLGCSENTVQNLLKALVRVGQISIHTEPWRKESGGTTRRIFCGRRLYTPVEERCPPKIGGSTPKNLEWVPPKNCGDTYTKSNSKGIPPIVPRVVFNLCADYAGEDGELLGAILGLLENRAAANKAPVKTTRSMNGILNKLDKLSGGDRKLKLALLDKATVANWLTVYPLKPDELPSPPTTRRDTMEFEKAIKLAQEYLSFCGPSYISVDDPRGIWFCASAIEVQYIANNAVCLPIGGDWDDIVKCRPFFELFPYVAIVTPNAIAREQLVKELSPRLSTCCIYVIQDAGFRGCKTIQEYIDAFGYDRLLDIYAGAEELPAYGLQDLSEVEVRDLTKVPRTLSGFPKLDRSIGGFFAGELSVWTGKRGIGKSTILSQLLLNAIDQGHKVCAYSGELDKAQFREWAYLQAAGPEHIGYRDDPMTGKRLPMVNPQVDKLISEWLHERFWLFDLERNTRHDPEAILSQFSYAKMRYRADVFLVDDIMSVDFDYRRDADFNRVQSQFTQALASFAKRQHVHVHLVVHPRKSSSGKAGDVTADDVHGSGDITNRADNVFFLTTHVVGEGQKPILVTLKNRDFGSKINQKLDFDKKSRRFFPDGGEPTKALGWEMAARQVEIQELPGGDKTLPF